MKKASKKKAPAVGSEMTDRIPIINDKASCPHCFCQVVYVNDKQHGLCCNCGFRRLVTWPWHQEPWATSPATTWTRTYGGGDVSFDNAKQNPS